MFKISDNLHSSFSNYTNFKCTYIFAKETTLTSTGYLLMTCDCSKGTTGKKHFFNSIKGG